MAVIDYRSLPIELLALAAALVTSLLLGPIAIHFLKSRFRERIASDSATLNELHAGKQQTPTMGGMLIMISFFAGLSLTLQDLRPTTRLIVVSAVVLCAIGAADDWIKLRTKKKGLTARQKLAAQVLAASTISMGLNQLRETSPGSLLSLVGWFPTMPSWLLIAWSTFVIVAMSNAVNLTDGLDGLAGGCTAITSLAMLIIFLLTGRFHEGIVVSAALLGAVLGFLWFNRHPAQVFMGDAGSLPLGGILALIALAGRIELTLSLTGFVFLVEVLSVMLQVFWYRRTGRRILLCSPLHNHFVFRKIPEVRIVLSFWSVAIIAAALGVGLTAAVFAQ